MATTVGQHSVAAFTSPVNGTTPIDANTVRGNDNTVRVAYVDHDADPGIHVQSSTIASRPSAGTAGRKWITEDSGVYTLWFDDGTNWHPVSSENVALTVLAGENLVKGDVVKVTGWNNGQDLPEVVKTTSASDTAFAVITAAVSSGSMGYATNTGIVQDVNTAAYSAGTILYANGSGGFTSTKPTSGHYQPCAYVLRSNTNNGVYYVEFSSPRIVESSANTASTIVLRDASGNFSAGTITAGALTSTGLVTFASLKGTGATTVTDILNDSTMATASATTLATSSSIKTYVDNKVATVDTLAEVLANGNTTGANDIVVNSGQKIRTPLVAAQDGTSAITIANTTGALTLASALADSNLATISTAGKVANSATTATSANTASAIVARDSSGNFSAGTITANLTGNISGTAPAGTLTGTTLASNVVSSSLTSLGTLTSLTVNGDITASTNQLKLAASTGNLGIGTATPAYKLDVVGSANVSTGNTYKVNGTDVLSATTLGSGVTASSLTSVGTLTSLTVNGDATVQAATGTRRTVYVGTTSTSIPGIASSDISMIRISSNQQSILEFEDRSQAANSKKMFMRLFDNKLGIYRAVNDAANASTLALEVENATGNLAVDTNTLYVDAANNRVGVGTASPQGALSVSNGTIFVGSEANTSQQNNLLNGYGYRIGTTLYGNVGIRSTYENAGNSANLEFYTAASGTNTAKVMELDKSGNLGLGVTPSAWTAIEKAIEISRAGNGIFSGGIDDVTINSNAYYAGAWKFGANGYANRFNVGSGNGQFQWFVSTTSNSSGAGANATFTQAMTLDASSHLSVVGGASVAGSQSGYAGGELRLGPTTSAADSAISTQATGAAGMFFDHRATSNTGYWRWRNGTGAADVRMTLDASGILMLGRTTAPSTAGAKIAIAGSGDTSYQVTKDGVVAGRITAVSTAMAFGVDTTDGATERARITSGGYFKASNTGSYLSSTGTYHELRSDANAVGVAITASNGSYTSAVIYANTGRAANSAFDLASLQAADVAQFRVQGDGVIYAQNTTVQSISDARLKENVSTATDGLDVITALRPVRYDWKAGYGNDRKNQLGFIAQEVEAVFPEAVSEWSIDEPTGEVDEDGKPITEKVDYKTVGPGALIPVLVKAIQELEARIAVLEAGA